MFHFCFVKPKETNEEKSLGTRIKLNLLQNFEKIPFSVIIFQDPWWRFIFNHFIEVWLTYKNLCIWNVYRLISLERSIHSWNHRCNQYHKHNTPKGSSHLIYLFIYIIRIQHKIYPLSKFSSISYNIFNQKHFAVEYNSRTYSFCINETLYP